MKQQRPKTIPRLLYLWAAVGILLLVGGVLTGGFYVSESTPVPSGSAVQIETFLPGPYLSISWNCPTGFSCPTASYGTYDQPPNSAVLPSIPQTGWLWAADLVPIVATLVVTLWFLVVFFPWSTTLRPRYRPTPLLLGGLGAITLAGEVLALLLTPTFLAADLARSPSGVPKTPGPWNSILGSSNFGHLTLTWGPAAGFYLTAVAGVILVLVSILWRRDPRSPAPD